MNRVPAILLRPRLIAGALALLLTVQIVPAQAPAVGPATPPPRTLTQINSLHGEKAGRTRAQRKLDSQLIYGGKIARGQTIAGVTSLRADLNLRTNGLVLVDINGTVSDRLLDRIQANGGLVVNHYKHFRAIRAWVPITSVESLADDTDVRFIGRAATAMVNVGSVTSQGDITHRAGEARTLFGVDGSGVKVGVLSDSINFITNAQALGDLGPVTVLPGQGGSGSGEGTAMLEIVHDLAPGSDLYFATAFNGPASFAQNIIDLRNAGCDIIIDDVTYLNESPFQDALISQAVNAVSADGALFFSSARNSGNKNDGTSGTWEGNFVDGGDAGGGRGGRLHNFGGTVFNIVGSGGSSRRVDLFWADPLGASTNDYDLYITDSLGNILRGSTTVQDGFGDPYEAVDTLNAGERIVIVKFSGEDRFLHLDTGRAVLSITTAGCVRGHNASGASNAFSVAATWVRNPVVPFTGGASNPVENYSSDGPRRMFFNPDGSPITPGNFLATGGVVLQKPDITAADGVSTSLPGSSGLNPFFGTSAAAPHAGAIAALVKSFNRALTPAEIRDILQSTALDIEAAGVDRDSGHGIVMAKAALQAVVATQSALGVTGGSVVEGDGGETNLVFDVGLFPPSTNTVTVSFSTTNGSATAGLDYIATNGSLVFLPGETNHTIAVTVLGETLPEGDETFELGLSSPTNGFLFQGAATGSILNDDPLPALSITGSSVIEGNSGLTNLLFTVSLSGPSGSPVSVQYHTSDDTAVDGSDYLATSGTLLFEPGATSTNISLTVLEDVVVEADESFYVILDQPTNATLAVSVAAGVILNDDGLPGEPDHFAWSAVSTPQYVGQLFEVTLTALDYFNQTATNFAGPAFLSAHIPGAGTLFATDFETLLPGFTVDNNLGNGNGLWHRTAGRGGDAGHSSSNSFYYGFGEGLGGGGSYNTGTSEGGLVSPLINLAGALAPVALQFNYLLQTEGDPNYDFALVEISTNNGVSFEPLADANTGGVLTNNTHGVWVAASLDLTPYVGQQIRLRFHFNSVDAVGNAFEGWYVDDVAVASAQAHPVLTPSLTGDFTNGIWSGTVAVQQTGTNVFLHANDQDGHLGDTGFFDVLTADDLSISFTGTPTSVLAGTGLAYSLNLFNTGPSTATGILVTNLLPEGISNIVVTPGQGSFTIESNAVICDVGSLNSLGFVTIGIAYTPLTAGTITHQAFVSRAEPDGDATNNAVTGVTTVFVPALSIQPATVVEGNAGVTNVVLSVQLSEPASFPVMVSYTTGDLDAVADSDYVPTNGVINFAPGETNQTIQVEVLGDTLFESNETFRVTLANPTNAILGLATAAVTILNDDVAPVLSIGDVTVLEGDAGVTNALFPLSLNTAGGRPVTVTFSTATGSAAAGADFTATAGVVTIPPGDTNAFVQVPVLGDTLNETNETFFVNLSAPVNATLANTQGAGVIEDDDALPTVVAAGVSVTADDCNHNGVVDAGELVTLAFALRNIGSRSASSNLVATLLPAADVYAPSGPQSYGVLAPGATKSNLFSFRANAMCGTVIQPALQLQDGLAALGQVSFPILLGYSSNLWTFANSGFISIPDSGKATPYPSSIVVSNLSGALRKVTVKLINLNHTWTDDLDVLLTGPGGQKVMLMSDAGGSSHPVNFTLTLDSDAALALPDSTAITNIVYRPADYETGDVLPSPAPGGPFSTSLHAFTNASPNGVWQLFVYDDAAGDQGSVAGGWELSLTMVNEGVCCQSPLEFVGPVRYTNGAVELSAFVTPGQGYQIQASTNLFDWLAVTNISSTSSPVLFLDPDAGSYPARFYRGLSQ
ncbi:MAG: Calx-beta domain-containing protein [Verrucomicrobiota bacterium]